MHTTFHALQRMSQRGVTKEMIDLVLEYGEISHDKAFLRRKEASALLAKMQRQMKVLKKVLDKGGMVVVAENGSIITTYNYEQ